MSSYFPNGQNKKKNYIKFTIAFGIIHSFQSKFYKSVPGKIIYNSLLGKTFFPKSCVSFCGESHVN